MIKSFLIKIWQTRSLNYWSVYNFLAKALSYEGMFEIQRSHWVIDLADCGWLQFSDKCHPKNQLEPCIAQLTETQTNKSDYSEKNMDKIFPDLFSSFWFRSVLFFLITLVFLFDLRRALYHVNILNVLENHSIWISVLGMQKRAQDLRRLGRSSTWSPSGIKTPSVA